MPCERRMLIGQLTDLGWVLNGTRGRGDPVINRSRSIWIYYCGAGTPIPACHPLLCFSVWISLHPILQQILIEQLLWAKHYSRSPPSWMYILIGRERNSNISLYLSILLFLNTNLKKWRDDVKDREWLCWASKGTIRESPWDHLILCQRLSSEMLQLRNQVFIPVRRNEKRFRRVFRYTIVCK